MIQLNVDDTLKNKNDQKFKFTLNVLILYSEISYPKGAL